MSIDGRGSSPSRAMQDRISALSSANQRLMADKELLRGQLAGARRTVWREVAQWIRDTCESEDDGRMCEECDSRAWLIENHAERFGDAEDPWGERDRARRFAEGLEQQIAAAQDALIAEARKFFLHARQRSGPQLDSQARYAHGQANGAEQTLAAFLTVVAYDEQPEYPDPIDCAHLYAEGRDPLKETS